jgi:hypothetical protein
MDSMNTSRIAAELERRAEERFGHERTQALKNDLEQMARELEALERYEVGFEDEP